MYRVLVSFIDGVEDRSYAAGDTFVVGPNTDEARIATLSTDNNSLRQPLIEKVEVAQVKQAVKGE